MNKKGTDRSGKEEARFDIERYNMLLEANRDRKVEFKSICNITLSGNLVSMNKGTDGLATYYVKVGNIDGFKKGFTEDVHLRDITST